MLMLLVLVDVVVASDYYWCLLLLLVFVLVDRWLCNSKENFDITMSDCVTMGMDF